MKKVILTIAVATFIFSCSESTNPETTTNSEVQQSEEQEDSEEEEAPVYPYADGAEIDMSTVSSVDELVAQMQEEEADSIQIAISADITQACKKKGCWMTIDLNNGEDMMVQFKDYDFFVPLDAGGHKTTVSGVAYKKVTTVDELRHYAEDAEASADSIASITEDKVEWAFMADGVVVE